MANKTLFASSRGAWLPPANTLNREGAGAYEYAPKQAFPRVVDNGRMLRNFVQVLRSGTVGRKSLGTAPKALVRGFVRRMRMELHRS